MLKQPSKALDLRFGDAAADEKAPPHHQPLDEKGGGADEQRGLGRALLEAVAKIGMEIGCGRFEWIGLRWNENAFRFYRSLGAKVMDDWALLRMNGREISNLVSAKVKVAT